MSENKVGPGKKGKIKKEEEEGGEERGRQKRASFLPAMQHSKREGLFGFVWDGGRGWGGRGVLAITGLALQPKRK